MGTSEKRDDEVRSKFRGDSEAERDLPQPVDSEVNLGQVMGSMTGEEFEAIEAPGGWAGTDDATSTAPSDLTSEERAKQDPLKKFRQLDPTGRAAAADLGEGELIADFDGSPVDDSRDWTHVPSDSAIDSLEE